MGRRWLPPLGVGVLAAGLRCLYVFEVAASPGVRFPMADALAYHERALAILGGDWLGSRVFYQDPLYPYFLAGLYGLFGEGSVAVLYAQALLDTATVLLVYALAGRVFGPGRALLAGLLAACYPLLLFYAALRLKVTLSLFLAALALVALLRADARERAPAWLAGGFALGLATLTRGNYLLFLPVLLAWIALRRGVPGAARWRAAACVGAGLVLALLPVTVRNRVVGGPGEWVLVTSQAGQNFYIGNFRGNGSGTYLPPAFVTAHAHHEEDDFRAEAKRRLGVELSPSALSRYWLREGVAEIRADPGHAATHALRKLRLVASDFEIPDNQSYGFFRAEVSRLLALPWPGFGALLPFALYGMFLSRRDRRAGLLVLYAAVYAATLVLVFTSSRYRMPLVPVVIPFAAHGILALAARLRERRFREALAAVAFLAVAYPLTFQRVAGEDFSYPRANLGIQLGRRASELRQLAAGQRETGEPARAEAALTEAAELSRLAEDELRRSLDANPHSPRVRAALRHQLEVRAEELLRAGDAQAALEAARALAVTFPDDPVARILLARLLAETGRPDAAREAFAEALQRWPRNLRVRAEWERWEAEAAARE